MDYKNFSINISNDIDHKDYDQHLKQLDNMLAQFQDEHFEWCLDYYNSCFWLNLNYKNNGDQRQGYKKWHDDQISPIVRIVIKNTNGIDSLNKLLNIKYFQSALDIMKTLVTYKDPQYDEDFIVKFNLDDNKLSYVNRDWDNQEFKFPLDDFSIFPTLIINAIDFVRNLHNNRNNQNINLQNSLELQLLKTIIDDQVDQSSDQDIQELKQELTDPETTYLQLENDVYGIDWNIDVNKKSMSFELLIDDYDSYYEFKPLELSFQEVAKLTNDRQINQILKAWKTNLNAKTNDQVIYNTLGQKNGTLQ